jgi:type I restriction enzyme S subunit
MIQHLEATAQALYRKTFVDNIDKENLPEGWRMGTIGEFGVVITGKTPSSDNPEDFGNDMPFVTPGDFGRYHKFAIGAERELSEIGVKRLKGKVLPKGSVIVTCIGSNMGKVSIASEECITNQQMNSIIVNRREYSDYLFYVLSFISKELRAMALGSSTMPLLNKSDFERIGVIFPSNDLLVKFSQLLNTCNETKILKQKENIKLTELQSLLLAKIGQ